MVAFTLTSMSAFSASLQSMNKEKLEKEFIGKAEH